MRVAASDTAVSSSTSVKEINVEKTEMLQLEIPKMDMLSEMLEKTMLPSPEPERKQKTWNQRIKEHCDDWDSNWISVQTFLRHYREFLTCLNRKSSVNCRSKRSSRLLKFS